MSKARTKRRYLAVRRYWKRVIKLTRDDRRVEMPSLSKGRRRYLRSLGVRARAKDVNYHLAKARHFYDTTCTPTRRGRCMPGSHRPPQGPNEDVALCPTCGALSHAMRPEGETYGHHIPDCSLTRRHPSYCEPGGFGHPPAPTIRGYWPQFCGNPEPHEPHEHDGNPVSFRRDCRGRQNDANDPS